MLISGIRQTSQDHLTLTLENGEEIRTTLSVVTDARLYRGRDLDDRALDEFRLNSLRALTTERAIEMLSHRPMSRLEMQRKLILKDIDPETARYCADWLQDKGLINEENYACSVARHYAAKGYGAGRIRGELAHRGVPREYWEEALEQLPEPDAKIDRFLAARLKDPEDRDEVRRVSAALYRRGYSWDEIRSALNRYGADD